VEKMSAKGIGVLLMGLGVGSFILPFFGLQFRIMSFFGGATWIIAVVMTLLGLGLIIKSD